MKYFLLVYIFMLLELNLIQGQYQNTPNRQNMYWNRYRGGVSQPGLWRQVPVFTNKFKGVVPVNSEDYLPDQIINSQSVPDSMSQLEQEPIGDPGPKVEHPPNKQLPIIAVDPPVPVGNPEHPPNKQLPIIAVDPPGPVGNPNPYPIPALPHLPQAIDVTLDGELECEHIDGLDDQLDQSGKPRPKKIRRRIKFNGQLEIGKLHSIVFPKHLRVTPNKMYDQYVNKDYQVPANNIELFPETNQPEISSKDIQPEIPNKVNQPEIPDIDNQPETPNKVNQPLLKYLGISPVVEESQIMSRNGESGIFKRNRELPTGYLGGYSLNNQQGQLYRNGDLTKFDTEDADKFVTRQYGGVDNVAGKVINGMLGVGKGLVDGAEYGGGYHGPSPLNAPDEFQRKPQTIILQPGYNGYQPGGVVYQPGAPVGYQPGGVVYQPGAPVYRPAVSLYPQPSYIGGVAYQPVGGVVLSPRHGNAGYSKKMDDKDANQLVTRQATNIAGRVMDGILGLRNELTGGGLHGYQPGAAVGYQPGAEARYRSAATVYQPGEGGAYVLSSRCIHNRARSSADKDSKTSRIYCQVENRFG